MNQTMNPKTEKISAIKALREFTLNTFGTTASLKISKAFIDALCVQIDETRISAFDAQVTEAMRNGLTIAQMEEVLRKYTPKIW